MGTRQSLQDCCGESQKSSSQQQECRADHTDQQGQYRRVPGGLAQGRGFYHWSSRRPGKLLLRVGPHWRTLPLQRVPCLLRSVQGDALARTGWYNVTFYNFIQWEEGTQLYESAQWVVDGYDSGDYTLMVDNGLLKWGRTQKLPYLTKETFQGKHLCNKPDRVCKTAVVKAKKAQVNSRSAELTTRINKASIDVCLEGWLRGEASIIGAHADQENFYFEWVPTGERSPFKEFPAFYDQFKGDALARTGWYNVTFYNFIQWEEGTQLYESAQWVVDGYDSGDYTLMVDNGLLKWGRTQ